MSSTTGYAEGSIAGVALVDSASDPCRALIVDGGNLKPSRIVNVRIGAAAGAGSVSAQIFNDSLKGRRFGVRFESIPNALYSSIVTAINTSQEASNPFNVTLDDNFHVINTNCWLEGFPTTQEQRTSQYADGIVFRFITA